MLRTKEKVLNDKFDYKPILKDSIHYVPIHHPSYIYIYKRKQIEKYFESITKIIEKILQRPETKNFL